MKYLHRLSGVSGLLVACMLSFSSVLTAQNECNNICISFGEPEVRENQIFTPVILNATNTNGIMEFTYFQASVQFAPGQDYDGSDIIDSEIPAFRDANQYTGGAIDSPFLLANDRIIYIFESDGEFIAIPDGAVIFTMVLEIPEIEPLSFGYVAGDTPDFEGTCVISKNCEEPPMNPCNIEIVEICRENGIVFVSVLRDGEPIGEYDPNCCIFWEGIPGVLPNDCENPRPSLPRRNDNEFAEYFGREYTVSVTCGDCTYEYAGALGDLCEEAPIMIAGTVSAVGPQMCDDAQADRISEVNIIITDTETGQIACQIMTDELGQYKCEVPSGGNYTVRAEKEGNIACGITQDDLDRLEDHILDVERLQTWRELFAADANGNESISVWDQIHIEGFFNGTPIANSTPWRFFVPESYNSLAIGIPFEPLPEVEQVHEFTNLEVDQNNVNFLGIKIGDLDGDCTNCNGEEGSGRRDGVLPANNTQTPTVSSTPLLVPNPFSNQTTLYFNLSKKSNVQIEITNSLGQRMDNYQATLSAGANSWTWQPASSLSAGIYWYKIKIDGQLYSGRLLKN
ncbi:MAG: hypothetical protein DHS20C18_11970 [Saprospiraceae bacterium]|nr:MAG: hypothetical protein DHS20C18_11970 [Saprospiraceae bacterium]